MSERPHVHDEPDGVGLPPTEEAVARDAVRHEEPPVESDPEPRDDVLAASSLIAEVIAYERRLDDARRRGGNRFWAQVAYVGALGWMIALPIAGGAMAGHYVDGRFGTGITWTLAGMSLGLVIAGYFVWRVMFASQGDMI